MSSYTECYYYHEGECLMELLEWGYPYECCKFAKGGCQDFTNKPKDEFIESISKI